MIQSKVLIGRGKLIGIDFDCSAFYHLTERTGVIRIRTLDEPSGEIPGSITISGRVNPIGCPVPEPGITLTLMLEDGRKMKVITGFDGNVTGTGGYIK